MNNLWMKTHLSKRCDNKVFCCVPERGRDSWKNWKEKRGSRGDRNISLWKYQHLGTHIQYMLFPSHSFFQLLFLRLTLRWRGRSYVRPSLVTCRSPSRSGRGRTLVSGPGGRMCEGWGWDSASPEGCDLVTRHFLLHNWNMRTRIEKVWLLKRTMRKHFLSTNLITCEKVFKPVRICLCDGDAWWDSEGKSCWTWHIAEDLWWASAISRAKPARYLYS